MKNKLLKYFLSRYKQSSCNTSLEHCLNTAEAMYKKSKYCFLVSNGSNGWCSSRQVQPIFRKDDKTDGNFTIWVGTRTEEL
ncbi:MAG TPA: hypothetical protein EYG68_08545 [Leucothrix mucor]|nr:hypothetical protein [Leucothrix mucor]